MSAARNAARFGLILAVIALSGARAQDSARQPPAAIIPKAWTLDLDPDDIDSAIKPAFQADNGTMPQQGMNQYLGIMASIWDAKLLATYLKLSAKLTDPARHKLCDEQTLWLKLREKQSTAAAQGESGGTLAPATYSDTFIKLTRARATALQSRLDHPAK